MDYFYYVNEVTSSSMRYCNDHFNHYADFAILPLKIAYYKSSDSKSFFGQLQFTTSQRMEEFIKKLVYDDSEFFEPEEMRFFCMFRNSRGLRAPSDSTIELDRQNLQNEIEDPTHIGSSYARYLLKAMDFWVLRSDEKLLEWDADLKNAVREWQIRTKPLEYYSEDEDEFTEEEEENYDDDDGYFSDVEQ
jgi:hypothetical protein